MPDRTAFIHLTRKLGRDQPTVERWVRVDHVVEVISRTEPSRHAPDVVIAEGCIVITATGGTIMADESIEQVMTALASYYGGEPA